MPMRVVLLLFLLTSSLYALDYKMELTGLNDSKAQNALRSTSQLFSLQKRPPTSLNALRYRADADIPVLIKVLEAYGYYEAKVYVEIEEKRDKAYVKIVIDPGPLYTLRAYEIHLTCSQGSSCCVLTAPEVGIVLGSPAGAEAILNAELKVLNALSSCGYPLSEVSEREVIVDGLSKTVSVELFVTSLSHCAFGKTALSGEKKVKPLFIERKILWKEGESYDSHLVEKTQQDLIDSGLFSSVLITHEETPGANGTLPMKIEVVENKYRSINIGVSYQTVFGPGLTMGWEHRNIAGMGRRFTIQGDVTRISHTGIARYLHPDFLYQGLDLIAEGEANHEALYAYSMRSYSGSYRFDQKYGKRIRFSVGLQGERLLQTESLDNGNFWLLEAPLYVRFSTANDLLNPTRGVTLEGLIIPTANIDRVTTYYATQEISESAYLSLTENDKIVLAESITLGMSWYHHLGTIPLSKRFLGGSEQDLRGYRYRTVSPLIGSLPEGGGSCVYGSVEARLRVSEYIGLVPFLDIGNVYLQSFPSFDGKWLKSMGLGLRYFSFMGPFRLDVAFPLNRRKGIDPVYKILVSIGQTF